MRDETHMGRGAQGTHGLTTDEAMQAFLNGRLDRLPSRNRWKFALLDHQHGMHRAAADTYARVCPACQRETRVRVA